MPYFITSTLWGLRAPPKQNSYGTPVHRLNTLLPWISHIKEIGCNALYIGPLFESVGHGYETTDYKTLDSRLGINSELGAIRHQTKALVFGDYKELLLTNRQYAFSRIYNGETVLVAVNNDDNLSVSIDGNFGEIWAPAEKTLSPRF